MTRPSASRLAAVVLWLMALAAVGTGDPACTPDQGRTAADVAVRIADETCREEAQDDAAPDWVRVACAVEGPAGGLVHVLLPRADWVAIRSKRRPPCTPTPCTGGGDGGAPAFEAGPGK